NVAVAVAVAVGVGVGVRVAVGVGVGVSVAVAVAVAVAVGVGVGVNVAVAVAMFSHGPDVVAATGNRVEYREATGTGAGDYVPATGFTVFFLHDLKIFDGHVGRRDARERKEYC